MNNLLSSTGAQRSARVDSEDDKISALRAAAREVRDHGGLAAVEKSHPGWTKSVARNLSSWRQGNNPFWGQQTIQDLERCLKQALESPAAAIVVAASPDWIRLVRMYTGSKAETETAEHGTDNERVQKSFISSGGRRPTGPSDLIPHAQGHEQSEAGTL